MLGGRWTVHNPNDPLSITWEALKTKTYFTNMNTMAVLGTRPPTEEELLAAPFKPSKSFEVDKEEIYYKHAYGVLKFDGEE